MASLLIKNIGMLATACGDRAKSGKAQGEILTLQNAYVLVQDEQILEIGQGEPTIDPACEVIDAQGKLVTAGLVDAHTHLVFGGWRENELALKLHGVPYLDILAQGGGILSTVRSTRAASEDELFDKTAKALDTMLSLGTTTCEAKSGYGLDFENECKQLNVTRRLNQSQPVELVSTFMAAHALPEEYKNDREGYLSLVIDRMLPYVAEHQLAEYCDVFCETGVFTGGIRRILTAQGNWVWVQKFMPTRSTPSEARSLPARSVQFLPNISSFVRRKASNPWQRAAPSPACCLRPPSIWERPLLLSDRWSKPVYRWQSPVTSTPAPHRTFRCSWQ